MRLCLTIFLVLLNFSAKAENILYEQRVIEAVKEIASTLNTAEKRKLKTYLDDHLEDGTKIIVKGNKDSRSIDVTLSKDTVSDYKLIAPYFGGNPDFDRVHISFDRRTAAGNVELVHFKKEEKLTLAYRTQCAYRMRLDKKYDARFFKFECTVNAQTLTKDQ